jgi:O-antigen ligase
MIIKKSSLRPLRSRNTQPGVAARVAGSPWVIDSRYGLLLTLMMFALICYLAVAQDLLNGPRTHAVEPYDPSPFLRGVKFTLLGLGAIVVAVRLSLAAVVLKETNRFFIAFFLLVPLSSLWSIEPGVTGVRFVAICTMTLVCLAFTLVSWHPRRFQNVLRSLFTLLLFGSIVWCIVAPELAREVGDDISLKGAWHGLFYQKNTYGHAAAITILLWTHGWLAREIRFRWFALGMAVSVTSLVLSHSSTSMFAVICVIPFLLLVLRGPKSRPRVMALVTSIFVLVILLYSLAVLNVFPSLGVLLEPVTAITGKDLTFSGRTQIWEVVREHITERPLLGSGFGAYWIGPVATSPSYVFLKNSDFYPGDSHNGYLEIINDLGYVGLICLLGYLLVMLRQALALRRHDFVQATLYLGLLFEELVTNLTESDWFFTGSFAFVVMTLVTFAQARAAAEQRLRAAAGTPAAGTPAAGTARAAGVLRARPG